jgi:Tfp pilus assembly protein PilE
MHRGRTRATGFTLVEAVVVIAFFGILAGLAVYAVENVAGTRASTVCARDEQTVRNAEATFFARQGGYADEATLVRAGLLAGPSLLHDVTTSGFTYTITSSGACATEVLSDGFEPPVVAAAPSGGSYTVRYPATFGAWTVTSGDIAVVSTARWHLPVGAMQSVELSATKYGAIRRTIPGLVPGNTYTLRFAYAVDPCVSNSGVRVQVGDLDTTMTVTNSAIDGYRTAMYSFTAKRNAQLLTFTGSGPKPTCGVVIDDVVVTT